MTRQYGSAFTSMARSAAVRAALTPRTGATVAGGHGYAFQVKRGTTFRIIDTHGRQIVDMMAWVVPYPESLEHLSMSYTRYSLGYNNASPAIGDCLVTNKQEPIFKLTHDTCHTHDMTFMACNPAFYAKMGMAGHRNCAENIAEAMAPFGMKNYLEATSVDPFNVFQNTPDMTLKDLGCSRPGDYVEFEVLKDAVVAVSSCPYDAHGFGGGKATEIEIIQGFPDTPAGVYYGSDEEVTSAGACYGSDEEISSAGAFYESDEDSMRT